MKNILFTLLILCLLQGVLNASESMSFTGKTLLPSALQGQPVTPNREAPSYTYTKLPTSLITSYYDYMMGSYNSLPIRVIPDVAGGGYFLTYHAKRTPTGTRRVFYAHIDAAGNVINNNEITAVTNLEGYPTLAIDPVSGKPLYAWHADLDATEVVDVQFTSDAFMSGISGLFNDVQLIIDNPYTITPAQGNPTTNNEFIWPSAVIGPSPIAGKQRVYVLARNRIVHSFGPSENAYIAYADFNGEMLETAVPLTWSYTSIPLMNQWNHGPEWRRPFMSLAVDDIGNIFYSGYHFATEADGTTDISEEDIDIFVCPNYGQGTWNYISGWSHIPSWNPAGTPGGAGYFVDASSNSYPDNEMVWAIVNSSHMNSIHDNRGRIMFPGLWAQSTTSGGYWDTYHTVKCLIYDTATNSFSVNEIYPQKDPADTFNQCFTGWDVEAPWGEPEYAPGTDGNLYLNPETIYPFPHWDNTLHDNAMYLHYSSIKVSEVNDQNMMVAVWPDSQRARWYNRDNDAAYIAYAETPEIYISVSANGGDDWSEPIVLNNVDNPEFAGINPMWVYPADKVQFVDEIDGHKVGKIGLMLWDDFTWGANATDLPAHPVNDGGRVMFMEMQITFPIHTANEDSVIPAVTKMLNPNYPNPFNPETTISFDMPKTGKARLDIYNVKGQKVKTLFDGVADFGKTNLVWNGTDNSGATVTSGVYFYRLSTEKATETRKMMLMK